MVASVFEGVTVLFIGLIFVLLLLKEEEESSARKMAIRSLARLRERKRKKGEKQKSEKKRKIHPMHSLACTRLLKREGRPDVHCLPPPSPPRRESSWTPRVGSVCGVV